MKWFEMSYWRYWQRSDDYPEPEVWDERFEPSDVQYAQWIEDAEGDG